MPGETIGRTAVCAGRVGRSDLGFAQSVLELGYMQVPDGVARCRARCSWRLARPASVSGRGRDGVLAARLAGCRSSWRRAWERKGKRGEREAGWEKQGERCEWRRLISWSKNGMEKKGGG